MEMRESFFHIRLSSYTAISTSLPPPRLSIQKYIFVWSIIQWIELKGERSTTKEVKVSTSVPKLLTKFETMRKDLYVKTFLV